MKAKLALKVLGSALILSTLSVGPIGCERTLHVTERMTWECAPKEYNPAFSAKPDEYVLFRFVENPRCVELETSRNFCAELQKAGRPIVNVDFEIHGVGRTVHGYRMLAVDGRPIQEIDGWGGVGAMDYSGPSPIENAFRSH